MDQRNGSRPRQTRPNPAGGILLASVILAISIIIAGSSVSSSVKKLTEAVKEQTFTSSFSSPSAITISSAVNKSYYTVPEAAAYLNMTEDEIMAAISKKEIDEYVKTSAGYSISQKKLDEFFADRAYATLNSSNSSGD